MLRDVDYVLAELEWMRRERVWPNGLRYLWTDAFGVVLYLSLHQETGQGHWIEDAEQLVADVERVLGRPRGLRIGEASERDGQYFHYLAMWLFALARLGDVRPEYRAKGIRLAKDIHPAFVVPGRGVIWKMAEDLSAPYPGYGPGAMDPFDGYVSYRLLDEQALAPEIAGMQALIDRQSPTLAIDQDLGLGMMLWLASFFPQEDWAKVQTRRASRRSTDSGPIRPATSGGRAMPARSGSRSPTTAWRSASRQLVAGPSGSIASTTTSNATAPATSTTARRSPTSWRAPRTCRAGFSRTEVALSRRRRRATRRPWTRRATGEDGLRDRGSAGNQVDQKS